MFVHCNKCNWEQEDFFDDSFNPAKYLAREYNEVLFGLETNELKEITHSINNEIITKQENIARWYEHFGKRIREMKWTTEKQFYSDNNKTCPKCGSKDLSTD